MTLHKSRPGLIGSRRRFCSQRNIENTLEWLKGASQEQSCSFNPSLGYHNTKQPSADHHTEEKLLLLEVLKHFSPPVHRDVGRNKVAGKNVKYSHFSLFMSASVKTQRYWSVGRKRLRLKLNSCNPSHNLWINHHMRAVSTVCGSFPASAKVIFQF